MNKILSSVSHYQPNLITGDHIDAAVLLPLRLSEQGEIEVILTVRANHLNSHPGEIAFPGGKAESEDKDLIDTALRESHEEIGLWPENVQVVGLLDQVVSKWGVRVQPVVGIINQLQPLKASPDEIDEIFTVPFSFFEMQRPAYKKHVFQGKQIVMAEYQYKGYRIWGLTSRVIINLLNIAYCLNIPHYNQVELAGRD